MKITIVLGTLALGGLVACGPNKQQFVAEGTVEGAEGQMLYLEEVGTGSFLSIDSTRLDQLGAFRFEHDGASYPMFYRIRLGENSIPFAADSMTHIKIRTSATAFFEGYELLEAEQYNYQIRDISHYRYQTDRRVDSLLLLYTSGLLGLDEVREAVDSVKVAFKHDMVSRYIYVDPKSPASYYALFQRKGGDAAYFSADDEGDDRAFAAVATAYDTYYSAAPYTPFLKDLALRAIALSRVRKARQEALPDSTKAPVQTIAYPEIKLKDRHGVEQSLGSYAERGTVLLSFTAYSAQWSPSLVATLRELKEANPNLTIYEVSVDGDAYYWENASRTLPWVSVNDPEQYSLRNYNVQQLPTFFAIKNGELRRLEHPKQILQ
ncbi:MAG: DUF4369 domain-containing protein [Porphyromonadaceae bacterium]|nr:DUF4369 domain-containing protein [Porphyromonadaceae bacterium]